MSYSFPTCIHNLHWGSIFVLCGGLNKSYIAQPKENLDGKCLVSDQNPIVMGRKDNNSLAWCELQI